MTMLDLTIQAMSVMTDGGAREGTLVLAGGHLVAVFSTVTLEETSGGKDPTGGWFLEAGFGPCGVLQTTRPPVFEGSQAALAWVGQMLEQDPTQPR